MSSVTRRAFFTGIIDRIGYASPALAMFGLKFCPYGAAMLRANGKNFPWAGWIEFFGKTIGFMKRDGSFVWYPC